jgi:hypothetical protein
VPGFSNIVLKAVAMIADGVRIWSMLPVRDPNAEENEEVPKRLCHMTNHTGMNHAH